MEPKDTVVQKNILPSTRFLRIVALVLVVLVIILAVRRFFISHMIVETPNRTLVVVQKSPDSALNDTFPSPNSWFMQIPNETSSVPSSSTSAGTTPVADTSPASPENSSPAKTPAPIGPPVITGLSQTTFGNGDTILINGANFTSSNTILLSVDLRRKWTNIAATSSELITFTPNLSVSAKLASDLTHLPASARTRALAKLQATAIGAVNRSDGLYLPATLRIQNRNGTSNAVSVRVDILKGI